MPFGLLAIYCNRDLALVQLSMSPESVLEWCNRMLVGDAVAKGVGDRPCWDLPQVRTCRFHVRLDRCRLGFGGSLGSWMAKTEQERFHMARITCQTLVRDGSLDCDFDAGLVSKLALTR